MLHPMRTTLVIDDAVLRRAKMRAARAGTTLSAVVEDALREALREQPAPAQTPFVFPTYGPPPPRRGQKRARVAHTPADFYAAIEADDIREFHTTSQTSMKR